MRNKVNPVAVKPEGSVNGNNSSRAAQSEINPYFGIVKRSISKIPKKVEGNQLINSSRITNKKNNTSEKQKIIEGNQLVKSKGARKKNISKVQNSLKENPAGNSFSPLTKKRKTSKIMKTSGEYGSSNFPSVLKKKVELITTQTSETYSSAKCPVGLINMNNSTQKSANEVYPVELNSEVINKNNSTKTAANEINPQVVVRRINVPEISSNSEKNSGVNLYKAIKKKTLRSNKTSVFNEYPLTNSPADFTNKSSSIPALEKKVLTGLYPQEIFNKKNLSNPPEDSVNPPRRGRQVVVRKSVVPEKPNNIEKNSDMNLYQDFISKSNSIPALEKDVLMGLYPQGFFNKKNSSNPPEDSVNPPGIGRQDLRDETYLSEILMDIEDGGPTDSSGSANKKWKKSRFLKGFMYGNYFFPRRSERIRLMAERRQNEANLPINNEPVKKKVSVIQKKRKPRIITEDSQKRNLQRNVSESALSSCTILSPNVRCHDKVPESITGIFTKEGKNYVTLKWKHSEEEDYILEDNLTDSMKVLLSDYVEAIRRRSQISQLQDTLPADEETSQSTEMPNSSNGGKSDILSPKFIKNNIMNFKNKQKLCIEENNLFDNLSAYTVDVKFHI